MGVRRIEALIKGLPTGSATAKALDEGQRVGWGYQEELLAVCAELIDRQNRYVLQTMGGVKPNKLGSPIFINRPLTPVKKRPATAADIRKIVGVEVPVIVKE